MISYPPIAYPTLLESPDSSVYLLRKYSHSLSAMNFSHLFCFSTQLGFNGGRWSDGRGLTIWSMPFLIRNLNNKVGNEHRNCSVRSLKNFSLTVSTEVLSSTACSSQKSSAIFSNHCNKFVLPLQIIFSSNCWSLVFFGFFIQEFLQKLGHWFYKLLMCFYKEYCFCLCGC